MSNQPEIEEPHIGSFIKEPQEDSAALSASGHGEEGGNHEDGSMNAGDEDYESGLEEKKDRALSIAFTLIGALTLVAGFGFYVNKYVQPSRTSMNPALLVDLADTAPAATSDSTDGGKLEASPESDKASQIAAERPSSNASTTVLLNADTFAGPIYGAGFGSSTQKSRNIITEYIIRAASTTPSNEGGSSLNGTSTAAASSAVRIDLLSEKVASSALGITFIKDPFWKQTASGNAVTLKRVGPEAKDVIYIKRFSGASVTTEDPENGNVMYFFDSQKGSWMKVEYVGQSLNQSGGGTKGVPVAFVPSRFTKDGKPVFEGTSRTRTLIVALDTSDFIIVNISGTGYAGILDYFVDGISSY